MPNFSFVILYVESPPASAKFRNGTAGGAHSRLVSFAASMPSGPSAAASSFAIRTARSGSRRLTSDFTGV